MSFLDVINKIFFTVQNIIKYCQQNIDIHVSNKLTLREAYMRVSYAECNCTKIMHARYFCVL